MALVNNLMKSGKKMLGITYLKSSRSVVGIKNFSAATSESTKPPQQDEAAADSILLDPKYKCIKDAAANLVAYDLLNSIGIGKNNNAINPLLQDLLDKLYNFQKKPSNPLLQDAAASLVAIDLLNSIWKNNHASPSPAINLLQDLLDNLNDFQNQPFTSKDNFKVMFDDTGMHLTLEVSNLGKEHLRLFVTDNTLLVSSTMKVAATGKKLWEKIELPQLCIYDPDRVTGHIIEGGALKVSFPYSKEEKKLPLWFQVNLV